MNDGPEQPPLAPSSSVSSTRRRLVATLLVTVVGALVCAAAGVRVVAPGEAALVYRLGKLVGDETTAVRPSGVLWAWPYPIDSVVRLASKRESTADLDLFWPSEPGDGQYALTGDRGLVGLQLTVRYVIVSPVKYQRSAAHPTELLYRVVAQDLQKTLLRSSLDEVLQLRGVRCHTNGRDTASRMLGNLADVVRDSSQQHLDALDAGALLTSLEIRTASPPHEVRDAFEMLQTARIEQETTQSRMRAQSDEVLFDAESLAKQTVAEARGNAELRRAETSTQVAMFEAHWSSVRRLGRAAACLRLRQEALRDILLQCEHVYYVTEPPAGGEVRVRIAPPRATP
ncbi:MAG: SPFH domain-containing protein [Pirellulales bacterium]